VPKGGQRGTWGDCPQAALGAMLAGVVPSPIVKTAVGGPSKGVQVLS